MRRWWDTEVAQRSLLLSSVHCRHLSRLVYLSTSTGSLFTSAAVYESVQRCPDTVCPYLLCPAGSFASVRPHSRADHSLGQEPVYLYTHRQCALVNVRKVYEIYAGGHNLVNVWKMGNRRCPAARSRVIHCGPKAPQGAHPLIL